MQLLILVSFSYSLFAIPKKQQGELLGILDSKGEAWIEVIEDSGFRNRYLAPWHGGSPSKGGGFDPYILGVIKDTVVGNRIRLKWRHDGHLRIEKLDVVFPRESKGVFTGKLIEIGDHWVDFENPEDRIPWRFYLRWIGGYPENGGGYDGKSREELVERSDEGLLRFRWSYDLRPRFESLLNLEGYQEPLFYEVEDLPPLLKESEIPIPPPVSNPFDAAPVPTPAPSANPFDMQSAPKVNPFDAAPESMVNPFDAAPKSTVNPFDVAPESTVNPFDAAPKSTVNPFDAAPISAPDPSANPFETQGKPKVNPFDVAPKPSANPIESAPAQVPVPSVNPFEQGSK